MLMCNSSLYLSKSVQKSDPAPCAVQSRAVFLVSLVLELAGLFYFILFLVVVSFAVNYLRKYLGTLFTRLIEWGISIKSRYLHLNAVTRLLFRGRPMLQVGWAETHLSLLLPSLVQRAAGWCVRTRCCLRDGSCHAASLPRNLAEGQSSLGGSLPSYGVAEALMYTFECVIYDGMNAFLGAVPHTQHTSERWAVPSRVEPGLGFSLRLGSQLQPCGGSFPGAECILNLTDIGFSADESPFLKYWTESYEEPRILLLYQKYIPVPGRLVGGFCWACDFMGSTGSSWLVGDKVLGSLSRTGGCCLLADSCGRTSAWGNIAACIWRGIM